MVKTDTAPLMDETWYRQCLAESIVDIAKGLARLAGVVEQMQHHGYLPRELREMSRDIRTPVADALRSFQKAAYPNQPITDIKFGC